MWRGCLHRLTALMAVESLPSDSMLQLCGRAVASAHDTHPGACKAVCAGLVQMLQKNKAQLSCALRSSPKAYPVVVCCSYVAGLFASAHDTHSGVRKAVCAGLVQMLQLQPERLAPHMEQIIEYMLESTQVSLPCWYTSACSCPTCLVPNQRSPL